MTSEIKITEDEFIENMEMFLEEADTTNLIIELDDGLAVVLVSIEWYNERIEKN